MDLNDAAFRKQAQLPKAAVQAIMESTGPERKRWDLLVFCLRGQMGMGPQHRCPSPDDRSFVLRPCPCAPPN